MRPFANACVERVRCEKKPTKQVKETYYDVCTYVCMYVYNVYTGRLKLSEKLGYPDFEPATNDAEEDQLTDQRLKMGWVCNEHRGFGGKEASFFCGR